MIALGMAALCIAPSVTQAQHASTPAGGDPPYGCRGFAFTVSVLYAAGKPVTHPVITQVYRNGPAERAGLREGDILIAVNGDDTLVTPPGHHWRQPPGTRYVFRIRRDGEDREFTLLSGRRAADGSPQQCTPVD